MEKDEAALILQRLKFVDKDQNFVNTLASAGKKFRLERIRDVSEDLVTWQHCASIEISRNWRGYCLRKRFAEIMTKNAAPTIESKTTEGVQNEISLTTSLSTSTKISAVLKNKFSDHTVGSSLAFGGNVQEEPVDASKTEPKPETSPARTISKPRTETVQYSRMHAASVIQKAWRRHIDMQVFCYYRDLINFRRQGNPSMMLRCINPAEAKLLDAATGTHIKFRLAGEKFPPNIYYKIYTHRPVVDMCANSPKDYTNAQAKLEPAKQIHTRDVPQAGDCGKYGWYTRVENNGWRLVSDRLIHAAMDPTTWVTSKKTLEFHHDKLVRKADLEKRRRQKKISWMHKMYKRGMLQVKVEDSETSDLVRKAADGLINTVDSHGPDGVMDWEVDELLQWTTALNFDDYLEGWKETATSNISEFEVEEMLAERSAKPPSLLDVPYETYHHLYGEPAEKNEKPLAFDSTQVPQTVKNP